MKAKKLNKKLVMVKETIANLQDIRGGEVRPTLDVTVCKSDCVTNCQSCSFNVVCCTDDCG